MIIKLCEEVAILFSSNQYVSEYHTCHTFKDLLVSVVLFVGIFLKFTTKGHVKYGQIIGSHEGYEKKQTILSRFSNYLILIDLFQEFKFDIMD